MPKLSLCIPTYNRAALLSEALAAIGREVNDSHAGQIEVVISDNASTDRTPEVVQNFTAGYPGLPVRYSRQSQLVGPDLNFHTVLSQAQGEFVYLLSDDDLLLPGAIARIFAILEQCPALDAVCLNMRSFQQTPDEPGPSAIPIDGDRLFNDKNEALSFLSTYLTFMSALIFRRAIMVAHDYTSRFGSYFVQAYIYLDVLDHNGGVYVTAEPFLATRSNNTGGYSFFEAFVTNFAGILRQAESLGFSPQACRAALVKHEDFLFGFAKVFKLRGQFGKLRPAYRDGFKRLCRVYAFDPVFLLKMAGVMFLPEFSVPLVYAVYKRARKSS